jgi:hypothetical protein
VADGEPLRLTQLDDSQVAWDLGRTGTFVRVPQGTGP